MAAAILAAMAVMAAMEVVVVTVAIAAATRYMIAMYVDSQSDMIALFAVCIIHDCACACIVGLLVCAPPPMKCKQVIPKTTSMIAHLQNLYVGLCKKKNTKQSFFERLHHLQVGIGGGLEFEEVIARPTCPGGRRRPIT